VRKGVAITIALVLTISIVLSALLFQLTTSATSLFGTTTVSTTTTELLSALINPYNPAESNQQIVMESYDWGNTTNLQLTLMNVGPDPVIIETYLINGNPVLYTPTGTCGYNLATTTLPAQTSCTEWIIPSGWITIGTSYIVKLVSLDGTLYWFTATAGYQASCPNCTNYAVSSWIE